MGFYGRNFGFRIVPTANNRLGRFATPSTAPASAATWLIGAPISGSGTVDDLGREIVQEASDGAVPVKGRDGILVYEHGDGATWIGDDPMLTTYSDKDSAPLETAVQVVSGPNVKVVFKNTEDVTFLETRDYTGRDMVDEGGGATPAVSVGDFLEPHATPSDTAGYWQVTATQAEAWLVVVGVDSDRQEVEAQLLF